MGRLEALAQRVHALERVDDGSVFRRKARVLQSLWRIEQGFPCGVHRGRKLGSRLPMPWARETLANFLTDGVREVVQAEVCDPVRSRGKVFARPRIFFDLLSSQPLAFNLCAPLSRDLELASAVFRAMTDGRCSSVTGIAFEHSPGRGDLRYTGDRSAFDVYVRFTAPAGGRGFAGIEVKYHEDLSGKPVRHRERYDAVAGEMGCFNRSALPDLRRSPLQQIWRDHLLVGAHRLVDGFADGFLIFLSPRDNEACARAIHDYAACLTSHETFTHWTLEDLVNTVRRLTDDPWIDVFHDRYLNSAKVDAHTAHLAPCGSCWEAGGGDKRRTLSTDDGHHAPIGSATATEADFLTDGSGRNFRGVVEDPLADFGAWLDFFNDAARQERMTEAEAVHNRPALAGVVAELESHPAFATYLAQDDPRNTYRGRQAVGVIVRMIMERLGWHKTGRRGSLPMAHWFTRAERYKPGGE